MSRTTVWADGGYAGRLVGYAQRVLRLVVTIVRKQDGQVGFAVLPRRWVVKRTLSGISRCRRLDHDYERLPAHSEAMIKWAMTGLMIMTGRLAPGPDDGLGSPRPGRHSRPSFNDPSQTRSQ